MDYKFNDYIVGDNLKMNLPTLIRNASSIVTRSIPSLPRHNGICRRINEATLRMGASTLANAKMKDGTTILVDLTTGTEKGAFYTGRYDSSLISTIHTILDPNACFLDVGANIGFYTISLASLYRSKNGNGRVIAFEPFESNYKRLCHNVTLNELQKYCILKNMGLSDETKMSEITLREDFAEGSETGNAAIPTNEDFDKGFTRVPIKLDRLDEVMAANEYNSLNIDMVKLDIEGHEDFFLRGAQDTIKSHRPTIMMEVNKPYYRSRNVELNSTFLPLIQPNYSLFREDQDQWIQFSSFDDCQELDNIFLIPNEKLDLARYHQFRDITTQ